jgi:hypothetical protein
LKKTQNILSQSQIEAFYHDNFVDSQVRDFIKLIGLRIYPHLGKIVDMGGGCGFFAKALQRHTDFKIRVVDTV